MSLKLGETDVLDNVTQYYYNVGGQLLATIDGLGNVTANGEENGSERLSRKLRRITES